MRGHKKIGPVYCIIAFRRRKTSIFSRDSTLNKTRVQFVPALRVSGCPGTLKIQIVSSDGNEFVNKPTAFYSVLLQIYLDNTAIKLFKERIIPPR